ncbi:hypothetical protein N0V93_010305 [Gnomoniopsis smithogilvyi]|uniref:Uncharacterized protein n=1 Tax=Gnomoniopsis smithogilvyi TaxID=1191159 RepID=A0A9W9CRP5_9PEZI|nr:hypothetical protein N0V93_010305 [Gnomoniopsis smithogilvyi]
MGPGDKGTLTSTTASPRPSNGTTSPIHSRTPSDTINLRRINSKRTYKTRVLQSREALQDDIVCCTHDLGIRMAKKMVLVHEVNIYNPQTQLDLIKVIKEKIMVSQSSLAEFQKMLASLDTTINEGSPQGQQLLVHCAHQSTSARPDDDRSMADSSLSIDLSSNPDSDAPLPENCVACLWAQWRTASTAKVQAQEKSVQGLKSRQAEAEKDFGAKGAKMEENKKIIAKLDEEIQFLKEDLGKLEKEQELNLQLLADY